MVVIAVEGSLLRQAVDHGCISRPPSTTPPSFLSSRQHQWRFSSSSSSASSSASSSSSSSVSTNFPFLLFSSSSSSTSSVVDSANSRRISSGGAARNNTSTRPGYGGIMAVANPSRPAVASRPGAFGSGPTARPVHAAIAETAGDGLKWWERGGAPNMLDIHSTQDFVDALAAAGDKLVIVEFFASWCPSCRALFPKFCKMAVENSDVFFLKVNFDENKPMCKRLNVKVLPFFHLYRGAEGRLDSFSCSLSKLQRLKDAIAKHHDGPCEDCAPPELMGDVLDSLLERASPDQAATAAGSSE